jgi:hypothetical protein
MTYGMSGQDDFPTLRVAWWEIGHSNAMRARKEVLESLRRGEHSGWGGSCGLKVTSAVRGEGQLGGHRRGVQGECCQWPMSSPGGATGHAASKVDASTDPGSPRE